MDPNKANEELLPLACASLEVQPDLKESSGLSSPDCEDIAPPGEDNEKRSFPVLGASPTVNSVTKKFVYPTSGATQDVIVEGNGSCETKIVLTCPDAVESSQCPSDGTVAMEAVQIAPEAEEVCCSEGDEADPWGQLIPEELLLKILHLAVQDSGPVPLLCRVAQVCNRWYVASCHPSMWLKVDLSIGWIHRSKDGLRSLCVYRMQNTQKLDLTAWFELDNQCLQYVASLCSRLTSLSISHCQKISAEGIKILADTCTGLTSLDISYVPPGAATRQSLNHLFTTKGSQLEKISVAGIVMPDNFDQVLATLAQHCGKLEELDLSEVTSFGEVFRTLDVEKLQWGCQKLRVLHMKNALLKPYTATEEVKAVSPGFPVLERFSAPQDMDFDFLQRVLKSSLELKSLDLRKSRVETIHSLPLVSLEFLSLPQQTGAVAPLRNLRWETTLQVLDLSWNKTSRNNLDLAFKGLFSPEQAPFLALHTLLLCGTNITFHGLSPILLRCSKLRHLNLLFCPLLPFGWSRDYEGSSLRDFKTRVGVITKEA